jgi:hypothetical protein
MDRILLYQNERDVAISGVIFVGIFGLRSKCRVSPLSLQHRKVKCREPASEPPSNRSDWFDRFTRECLLVECIFGVVKKFLFACTGLAAPASNLEVPCTTFSLVGGIAMIYYICCATKSYIKIGYLACGRAVRASKFSVPRVIVRAPLRSRDAAGSTGRY